MYKCYVHFLFSILFTFTNLSQALKPLLYFTLLIILQCPLKSTHKEKMYVYVPVFSSSSEQTQHFSTDCSSLQTATDTFLQRPPLGPDWDKK